MAREWEQWDSAFSKQADQYWRSSQLEIAWRTILQQDMARALAGPRQVLEVGCGSGLVYELMQEAGLIRSDEYVGGDISEPMLQLARHHYPGVSFISMDAYKLPYADRSQECVVCASVLQHLPDYQDVLKELLRVTREVLYIATWAHMGPEDRIVFNKFYENSFSVPRMLALLPEGAVATHLYRDNYSIVARPVQPEPEPEPEAKQLELELEPEPEPEPKLVVRVRPPSSQTYPREDS